MGNHLYRPTPRRTHNTEEGHYTFYDYGASQITGWRHKQEDRYICLPKFFEDWSLFAVYDGHGGEQVVQYLKRYLHQHIINELELQNDPELALYLGFLTCDNSLRNITVKEYSVIQDDLELEFEVADQEERREVIFGFKGLLSTDFAGTIKDASDSSGSTNDDDCAGEASKNSAGSAVTNEDITHAPGTSKGSSNPDIDELRAEVISACLNELPSIIFLTKAPFEREDESDEDYEPQKDNIEHDIFGTSAENGDKESTESEESAENEDEDSAGNDGEESAGNDGEESAGNEGEESSKNEDEESDKMEVEESSVKESDEFAKKKDAEQSGNHSGEGDKKNNNADVEMPSEPQKKEETTKGQNEADIYAAWSKPRADFGATCGSTATVLLLNEKKLFLANVGDSRCVACINGQAVDLSVDHKPTIEEESIRITNAGGTVSEDERVNDFLDMSRAFGDFGLKKKNVAEPFQILSCEPNITTIEVTDDLEFIIVASDGIWNTMDSIEVVDYLRNRMQDTEMELRDICGELFEEMLPSDVTSDGSGCDNMTAILIRFKKLDKARSAADTGFQECYKYYYPPEHRKKYVKPTANTSAGQDKMLPAHDCEKFKSQSKEVASCPSTSAGQDEMLPAHDCEEFKAQSKEVASCPSTSEDHCVSLDPGNSASDIEMENTIEPIQSSAPSSNTIGNEFNCRKHCQDLWSYICILKNKCDALNQDMIQAKRDVEDAILRCENCKCHSYVASSSSIHLNAAPSSSIHPNAAYSSSIHPNAASSSSIHSHATSSSSIHQHVASTSNIHQHVASSSSIHPHAASSSSIHPNTASSSSIHPNVASVTNLPMVNFDALHFKRRFKSQQEAAGSGSMTEQNEAESGSKTGKNVAANAFEVIDLCSEEDSSETVDNRVASEDEDDDENEPNYAQAMERAAEDADEVSKKIKSPDYTNFNAEKHK